jgi:hypothetical protein
MCAQLSGRIDTSHLSAIDDAGCRRAVVEWRLGWLKLLVPAAVLSGRYCVKVDLRAVLMSHRQGCRQPVPQDGEAGNGQHLSCVGDRGLGDHDVEVGVRAALVCEEGVNTQPPSTQGETPSASNMRSSSTTEVAVITE